MTVDLSVPQRQSPLAVIFLGLRVLGQVGLTQLALLALFIARGPFAGALVIVPVVVAGVLGAAGALAWWRYTFQLVDGGLVVVKGVIRMNRLTLPIQRIQSIAVDQTFLHRLTGLVKVAIDSAGSTTAEFTIHAIPRDVAEELQRAAVTACPTPEDTATVAGPHESDWSAPLSVADVTVSPPRLATPRGGDRVAFGHDAHRLFLTALTVWPLTALVLLGPLLAIRGTGTGWVLGRIPLLADIEASSFRWWFVPAGAVAFVLVSVALNLVRVFLHDWHLTLRVTPTSLRRTSGLLARTSTASSIARVQIISSEQNPLQQRAGLHAVALANIGDGNLTLPGCDIDQFAMVTRLAGSTPIEKLRLTRHIHSAAIWLRVRNSLIQSAVLAGAGAFLVGRWSILAFLIVPIAWFMEHRHVRNFRWALGSELATFSRVIDTASQQALLRKANTVQISQTIFERRRGLGTVHLNTATGAVSVGMLPIADACAVRDTVLHAAETDRRSWM